MVFNKVARMIRAPAHYNQDNQNKEEPKNREKHARLGHVVDMAMRNGEYWNHLSVENMLIYGRAWNKNASRTHGSRAK